MWSHLVYRTIVSFVNSSKQIVQLLAFSLFLHLPNRSLGTFYSTILAAIFSYSITAYKAALSLALLSRTSTYTAICAATALTSLLLRTCNMCLLKQQRPRFLQIRRASTNVITEQLALTEIAIMIYC